MENWETSNNKSKSEERENLIVVRSEEVRAVPSVINTILFVSNIAKKV